LSDLGEILGERPITIARELTKAHEEIVRTTANRARELKLRDKGEFTIVLGPQSAQVDKPQQIDDKELTAYFYRMTNNTRTRREALAMTADKFGLSTNDVYARLERAKAGSSS
jgi:16S rRNA (cytidine1402-2'-O)-methyltransferase